MDTKAHEWPELSLRSLTFLLFAGFGVGSGEGSLVSRVPPVSQISNVSPVFLSSLGQKNTRPVAGAGGDGSRPDDRGGQRRPVTPNTTLLWKVRQ